MARALAAALVAGATALALGQPGPRPIRFEGARILTGDGSAPVEDGVLLVRGDRIEAAGARDRVPTPPDAVRVDLAGKTVLPAFVNVHVHIGYEGYATWGAANHTPANVLDHLQRSAYYGTAATTSVGSSPLDQMFDVQAGQRAGRLPPAARLLFMPGFAPPDGGPDHVLREATRQRRVVVEVERPDQARAEVARVAGLGLRHVKMWVDDRNGTYPKLAPDVYGAIVEEAHQRRMRVHAHAIRLADQKAVLAAGADVLVHMVQREPLDEAFLTLLRERRPYWATVIGLGDPTEVCRPDPFFDAVMPPSVVARIRATTERVPLAPSCGTPPASSAERERQMAINFPKYLAAGARVVLATDTGIHPGHTFGSGEHVEIARWVQLGMTPAEAIVAATSRPAELMGLDDLGTLAGGKRASFLVLDANPLDDIRNTRRIADVYLDGRRLDRAALRAAFARERPAAPAGR